MLADHWQGILNNPTSRGEPEGPWLHGYEHIRSSDRMSCVASVSMRFPPPSTRNGWLFQVREGASRLFCDTFSCLLCLSVSPHHHTRSKATLEPCNVRGRTTQDPLIAATHLSLSLLAVLRTLTIYECMLMPRVHRQGSVVCHCRGTLTI